MENTINSNFNNDFLQSITLESGIGIKKGDTFKWKSPDAIPFKIARIEKIDNDNINFYFTTQNTDGTWPSEENKERKNLQEIEQYLSSAQKI